MSRASDPLPPALSGALNALHLALSRHAARASHGAIDRLCDSVCAAAAAFEAECAEHGNGIMLLDGGDSATTLEGLPTEILTRLINLAASRSSTRTASQMVASAARVSTTVRLAAERCWPEVMTSLFPSNHVPSPPRRPWMSFNPPADWHACLRQLSRTLESGTPSWVAMAADDNDASAVHDEPSAGGGGGEDRASSCVRSPGPSTFLPRQVFAHSTCVHEGKMYAAHTFYPTPDTNPEPNPGLGSHILSHPTPEPNPGVASHILFHP